MTTHTVNAIATGDPDLFQDQVSNNVMLTQGQVFTSNAVITTEIPHHTELVVAPEFGEHDSCEDCEHALSCMSGAFEYLAVAKSREEQREGKSLPCVDDGKVRLKIITEEEATVYAPVTMVSDDAQWGSDKLTIEPVDGLQMTAGTITINPKPDPNSTAGGWVVNQPSTTIEGLDLSSSTFIGSAPSSFGRDP